MSSSAPAASTHAPSPVQRLVSNMYKTLVTPVIFVSFLVSLAWVDLYYAARRSQAHSQAAARLPAWLHPLLGRGGGPYEEACQPRDAAAEPHLQASDGRWYYRTKQRKLLRMEAADAFAIRTTVLAILGLAAALAVWALWRTGRWAAGFLLGSTAAA